MPEQQQVNLSISPEQARKLLESVKSELSALRTSLGEGTNLAKEFVKAGIPKDKIPARFLDPISSEVYKDPVRLKEDLTEDGEPLLGKTNQVFDHSILMNWYKMELASGKALDKITHPYTGLAIQSPFEFCTAKDILEAAREFIRNWRTESSATACRR